MRYCLAPPRQHYRWIFNSISRPSLEKGIIGIFTFLTFLGAGGIAAWVGAYYTWEERQQHGPVLQQKLEEKIRNSMYPPDKKCSPFINRRGLLDIMKIFNLMKKKKTVVVCGPRGSGKTAAVMDSLAREEMVIVTTVVGEKDLDKKLARAIIESLGLYTKSDVNHNDVVVNALKTFQDRTKYKRPPVLVVEINERFKSPQVFENLLLALKDWGHDKELIYPVVVLSTSRAALGLKLSMNALRAQYVSVGDLHKDEAELYVKELCKESQLVGADDEKAVSKCAQIVVDAIGCRLLHLDGFADNVRSLKSTNEKVALEDLKVVAAKYERIQMEDSREALQELYKTFPKEKLHRHFFKKPGAAVNMDEFCKIVGKERKIVLETLSVIQPHPFYTDPDTRTVIVGSIFFQKAIDEG